MTSPRTRKTSKPAVAPTAETPWVHPWERAGLGTGPFRCIGYERSVFQAVPGDPNCPIKPGSACDYCGQGIMHVYVIQGADKRTFKVGIDCVLRVQDTAASVAAWKAELRAIRNEPAAKARREAAKAWRDAQAKERAERAEANAIDPTIADLMDRLQVAGECAHVPDYERGLVAFAYRELSEGYRSAITDREEQALRIAYPAAMLPAPRHIGKPGERLRGLRCRYEGGPTIGIDSPWGSSVLGKFRVTEGPYAGAVLLWKTAYHPTRKGALCTLTGTVDKDRPHDEYEGVKQTRVARCKVQDEDTTECVDLF